METRITGRKQSGRGASYLANNDFIEKYFVLVCMFTTIFIL